MPKPNLTNKSEIYISFTLKYEEKAQDRAHIAIHDMKEGKLKIGRSNKKVINPK